MFAFLCTLGYDVVAEETTNLGRIDMAIISPASVFVIEFKVDMSAEAALHQIETKKYYEKYQDKGKPVYLIGIHFTSKEKNISQFEYKVLPKDN